MINEFGAVGGLRTGRGNPNTWRKPAPVPLLSIHSQHALTWDASNYLTYGTAHHYHDGMFSIILFTLWEQNFALNILEITGHVLLCPVWEIIRSATFPLNHNLKYQCSSLSKSVTFYFL
jgi:hypothetical protein